MKSLCKSCSQENFSAVNNHHYTIPLYRVLPLVLQTQYHYDGRQWRYCINRASGKFSIHQYCYLFFEFGAWRINLSKLGSKFSKFGAVTFGKLCVGAERVLLGTNFTRKVDHPYEDGDLARRDLLGFLEILCEFFEIYFNCDEFWYLNNWSAIIYKHFFFQKSCQECWNVIQCPFAKLYSVFE